jgi:hypothetical protein
MKRRFVVSRASFRYLASATSLLLAASLVGQEPKGLDLIHSLRDEAGPRQNALFTCGSLGSEAATGRRVAASLARLGEPAVPNIEQTLARLEELGRQSGYADNAFWLLHAYAKADGAAALPRLCGMISSPHLGFLRPDLDSAAALALGLTSYVDSLRRPATVLCRHFEPRDALDDLVLAWQAGDRARVTAALGPEAKKALGNALNGTSWEHLRAALRRIRPGAALAVGYQFNVAGPWSQPPETLDDHGQDGSAYAPADLNIETIFKDGSGHDCGRRRVRFLAPSAVGADGRYFVDEAEIAGLLDLIASCSSEVGQRR